MRNAEAVYRLYYKRKESGSCTRCTSAAEPGRSLCYKHLDKVNKRMKVQKSKITPILKSLGLCTKCRKTSVKDRTLCLSCSEVASRGGSARRKSKISKGLCARCGLIPPQSNMTHCISCSKKDLKAQRLSKYGITQEEFDQRLVDQQNSCELCNRPFTDDRKPFIDYNHKTGKTRGLLCSGCNGKLGPIEDTQFHEKAIQYLRKYQS